MKEQQKISQSELDSLILQKEKREPTVTKELPKGINEANDAINLAEDRVAKWTSIYNRGNGAISWCFKGFYSKVCNVFD